MTRPRDFNELYSRIHILKLQMKPRVPTKYTVTEIPPHNSKLHEPVHIGETLYELKMNDYNSAYIDTKLLEVECIAVTRDPLGNYPFITMPLYCLKEETL